MNSIILCKIIIIVALVILMLMLYEKNGFLSNRRIYIPLLPDYTSKNIM